jgi:hypothetical protein
MATSSVRSPVRRGVAETDVEVLLAKQAIRENLQNYCRAIDRLDRELLQSVFHHDAITEYEGLFKGTADEVVDFFMVCHLGYQVHSHQLSNMTVKVNGDRAASETYVTAVIRSFPDDTGHCVDMHYRGRYLDRWSKRDGQWAIDQRYLVTDILSEYDVVQSFDGELPDRADTTTTLSRRDSEDAAYELFASVDA